MIVDTWSLKDTYYTIAQKSEGSYKEKGSRFLSFAYHVESESEIKNFTEGLRKKYFDARHHCYAFILGPDGSQFRTNDDGEPSHSAGDPILGQIRSKDLTDTLVVVVRYFGGTKLGISGLINAYKAAAADALENNNVITCFITRDVTLEFDYPELNWVMRLTKEFEIEIIEQTMEMDCRLRLKVRESLMEKLKAKIDQVHTIKLISS